MLLRQADVFAAYWAYTDEIGRMIQHAEDMGKPDKTLVIYIDSAIGSSGGRLADCSAPSIRESSFHFRQPKSRAPRMGAPGGVVTQGGRFGGCGF